MRNLNQKFRWLFCRTVIALAIGELLLVLTSWVLSAMMIDGVRPLLSSEGLRWFLGNFSVMLSTPTLVNLLLLSMAGGSLWRSGILRKPQSYRDKTALQSVAILLFFYVVAVLSLTVMPHAVLLSATGHLWPSPFSHALLPLVAVAALMAAAVYGTMSGRFSSFNEFIMSLTFGIAQAAPLFILYFVVAVFGLSFDYVWI